MAEDFIGYDAFFRLIQNGIDRYESKGKPFMTGFLTPAQITRSKPWLSHTDHILEGGHENALRKRLYIGEPDWAPQLVTCLKAKCSEPLRHSDVLGALMHAGLKRDALGDIAVDETGIYVICKPEIAPFVLENIRLIRHAPVVFEEVDTQDVPPVRFEEMTINISSLRLDCVVAALAKTSRTGAKEAISKGFVKVNDEVVDSIRPLCKNDTISVRRCGKYLIGDVSGTSRKGRLILAIKRYQ